MYQNKNKMMHKKIPAFMIVLFIGHFIKAQQQDLLKYVNTLQGTNSNVAYSNGNTYPTVALPFPIQAFSPQTGKNGDGWKYQYTIGTIRGFEQTHQCSPWVNDYAVFSLMPEVGTLEVNEDKRASAFKHANETAKPHYYKVTFDNGITTEISPVERGGHMRFSFPGNEKAYIVFDGYTGQSMVKIIPNERKIIGWVHNGIGFLQPKNFNGFFVLQFDQPFVSCGTWENKNGVVVKDNLTDEGDGKGAFIQFKPGSKVQVKMATSYISPEQAQLNLDTELGKFKKFEDTKDAAAKVWNQLLNTVLVEGDNEEDKATFYSCLFRANLFSHKFYEINKEGKPYYFSPYDAKVHDGYMYTDNGFWDTFRAQFPLSNILHPTMQGRYMQSLLDAQEQCGWLPTWSFPGMSGIMIGNHAITLLTDAWVKGIRSFDPHKALDAYFHEITNKGPFGGSNGREGSKEYFELGYIPYPEVGESAAKTLEYAYDDFCGYQLAKETGDKFHANIFGRQMYNYKNLWDPEVGFMRGKMKNGEWVPDFSPIRWGNPFTEGNSWQYSWSVFHDIQELIQLMGGNEKFIAKLDSFFNRKSDYDVGSYGQVIHEISEMLKANMGQYAHGNQPVQHVAYLYDYAGQPWKTQERVRKVMTQLYHFSENGYPGDEDQGGMSSWYVLSALGIYSVCPGTDQYVIGSPLFKKVTLTLENGNKFVIEASNNNKENVYIRSAMLNGKPYTHNWITYADIMNGGSLHFEMGNAPETSRGVNDEDKPFSLSR
jgi:predicted alpha-1,2-mannosidase